MVGVVTSIDWGHSIRTVSLPPTRYDQFTNEPFNDIGYHVVYEIDIEHVLNTKQIN